MAPSSDDWDFIIDRFRDLRDEHNRYVVYLIFVFIFSLPLIFILLYVDPCLFNLAVPGFALLIPYHLFKERNLKVVGIVGVIALLLLGLTFTAYQVESIYIGRSPEVVSSDHLIDGQIDRVHGRPDDRFEFTVIVSQDAYADLILDYNYTIQLNLSYYVGEEETVQDRYLMEYRENISDIGKLYHIEISDLDEELYEHHFTLDIEREDEDYSEETTTAFGPFTVGRGDLYIAIFAQLVSSYIITFSIFFAFLWWRTGTLEKAEKKRKAKKKGDLSEEED